MLRRSVLGVLLAASVISGVHDPARGSQANPSGGPAGAAAPVVAQVGPSTTVPAVKPPSVLNDPLGATTTVPVDPGPSTNRIGIALTTPGVRMAWGFNADGRLGNGDLSGEHRAVPDTPAGHVPLVGIAAGDQSLNVGITAAGVVYQWGQGSEDAHIVTEGISGVTAKGVIAGDGQGFVLGTNGSLWGWGYNGVGVLGDGTTTDRATPVRVSTSTGLTNAVWADAGPGRAAAVSSTGEVYQWGDNSSGQFGDGTVTSPLVPRILPRPVGMGTIARVSLGSDYTLALTTNGQVWAWGNDQCDNRGDGVAHLVSDPPNKVLIPGTVTITDVDGGSENPIAMDSLGQAWVWGCNTGGVGVQPGITGTVVQVQSGFLFRMARTSDGKVWAWGDNYDGVLGNGSVGGSSATPTPVKGPDGVTTLTGVTTFSVGGTHTQALVTPSTNLTVGYATDAIAAYSCSPIPLAAALAPAAAAPTAPRPSRRPRTLHTASPDEIAAAEAVNRALSKGQVPGASVAQTTDQGSRAPEAQALEPRDTEAPVLETSDTTNPPESTLSPPPESSTPRPRTNGALAAAATTPAQTVSNAGPNAMPGTGPLDLSVAVGPSDVVSVVNSQVYVATKVQSATPRLVSADFTTFFSAVQGSPQAFDPVVIWDRDSQRYFIVAIGLDGSCWRQRCLGMGWQGSVVMVR